MTDITISGLPEDTLSLLKEKASENNLSLEVVIVQILNEAVSQYNNPGLGEILRSVWRGNFGDDLNIERDQSGPRLYP